MSEKEPLRYAFFIRAATRVAQEQGVNPETLLRGTSLAPDSLSDPYQLISRAQELCFYHNLIHAIDIPWLGLKVGSASSLSGLGTVGHVRLASRDIREVIAGSLERYSLMNLHLTYDVKLKAGEVIHSVSEEEPLGELRQFMIDRCFAQTQCHAEELIGPECIPTVVRLDFPDPGYHDRYKELFQCPIRFNQPVNEIRYPFQFLDQPIPSHDPKVKEVLDSLCESLMQKLNVERDMVTDVKLAIRKKPGTFPNIEQVADNLGMSSRNLRRSLKEQGSSFQALLNEARRAVAEDYLLNSTLNVQKIAELCGFSDGQNFAQAFKRWTGQSPTDFRRGGNDKLR
jgi:AraC-like DNA-binding protein